MYLRSKVYLNIVSEWIHIEINFTIILQIIYVSEKQLKLWQWETRAL